MFWWAFCTQSMMNEQWIYWIIIWPRWMMYDAVWGRYRRAKWSHSNTKYINSYNNFNKFEYNGKSGNQHCGMGHANGINLSILIKWFVLSTAMFYSSMKFYMCISFYNQLHSSITICFPFNWCVCTAQIRTLNTEWTLESVFYRNAPCFYKSKLCIF